MSGEWPKKVHALPGELLSKFTMSKTFVSGVVVIDAIVF